MHWNKTFSLSVRRLDRLLNHVDFLRKHWHPGLEQVTVLKHYPMAVPHSFVDESVCSTLLALTKTHCSELLIAITILLSKIDQLESRVHTLAQYKDDRSSAI